MIRSIIRFRFLNVFILTVSGTIMGKEVVQHTLPFCIISKLLDNHRLGVIRIHNHMSIHKEVFLS